MANFKTWLVYRWRQILCCLLVVSALASTGSMIGWSVEVPKIAGDPDLSFNITVSEERWLVSSVGIVSVFTTLMSGWLMETFGPCRLLAALLLPQGLAWVLMSTSYSLPWIFVGRIVTGGIGFMLTTIVQPLIAELCQPDVRGMLSALPEMAVSVGLLVSYIFARFLPWQASTLLYGVLLIPCICAILFVPESPYWLLKRGREKDATRSLMKLRSPNHDIESEVMNIRQGINQQNLQSGTFRQQISALREAANYRPVILLAIVMFLKEAGGALFIFMFSAFFFTSADVLLDPFTCTILVGVTRLVFTFLSCLIIDKTGRRPLLIFSAISCGMSMAVIGVMQRMELEGLGWISLVAALIYVASFGLGVGPVPWILVGEMLPTPVRAIGASISICVFVFSSFLVAELIPEIIVRQGLDDAVFIFASSHILLAIVTWLFVPETRNLSLEELQSAFSGAALRPFNKSRDGYLQAYGSTFSETGPNQGKSSLRKK